MLPWAKNAHVNSEQLQWTANSLKKKKKEVWEQNFGGNSKV